MEFEESIDKKSRRRVAIDVVRLGGPGQADQEEILPQIKEGIVVEIRNPKDATTPASTPTSVEATLAVTPTGTDKNGSGPVGNAKKKVSGWNFYKNVLRLYRSFAVYVNFLSLFFCGVDLSID